MAEALVSFVLEQLASILIKQTKARVQLVVGVDEEVRMLTRNFQAIRAEIVDAKNRQVNEEAVRFWINELERAAYDIDDVLDEWNTELQKLQMKKDEKASMIKWKVCSPILFCCFSPRQLVLRNNIAGKIKHLNKTLDSIAKGKQGFGFINHTQCPREPERPMTSSISDEPHVFGRDRDKNKIRNFLLSESSQGPIISILSLVGMGGIGKTTLARLVFNDVHVNKHFSVKIWVCVSDPFNELRIAKAILESLNEKEAKDLVELEKVLQSILKYIEGKKFLLILDDVWTNNPENWNQLKGSLKSAFQGSKILLTTRKRDVAEVMGTTTIIQLGTLSEPDCWSLFSRIAFSRMTNGVPKEFEDVGREIMRKCDGLPLAIKALGSLLSLKTHVDQWQSVLDSDLWKLEEIEKALSPPILLSYYDLSSKLRKCFSYCAIFPKDYLLDKDILIKLWMAQGFLKVEANKEMELAGEEYFEKLVMRSLFQDFERSEYDGSIIRCKMHDIMHDFVQFISKNECFPIEDESDRIPQLEISYESVRHLYVRNSFVPHSILNLKKLRSFVGESAYFDRPCFFKCFEQLTCLRTLNLQYYKVPKGIKYLVHLRYLNLTGSIIKKLPEVLCDLYNLQTLDLTGCYDLEKLPQGIGKLVNLRHLLIGGTRSLRYIPKRVERLSYLKTLNKFVISGGDDYGNKACTSLDSLKNLKHGPSLELGLVNVRDRNALKLADFQSTKNLLDLTLSFSIQMEEGSKNEENVRIIEALQPPPNLEKLWLEFFGGKSMSFDWLVSLIKLRELRLVHCKNCEHLPPLGKLPSLESLKIESMQRLKRVGNEFLGIENDATSSSSIVAFPKLKFLDFDYLFEWEEWNHEISNSRDKDVTIMPCLRSLSIISCNKLKALPDKILQRPTLQQLDIINCPILNACHKETEDERSKISHIPKISIH